MDPSTYHPISLINIGGKVLEKLLINRINHHMYKNELQTDRQTIWIYAVEEYNRRSYGDKKIHSTGIGKQESGYNGQRRRQRSFRRSVVAKHPRGNERLRMP